MKTVQFPAVTPIVEQTISLVQRRDDSWRKDFVEGLAYMDSSEQMKAFKAGEEVHRSVTQASLSFLADMLGENDIIALRDDKVWAAESKRRLAGLGFQSAPRGSFSTVQSTVKYAVKHGLIDSLFCWSPADEDGNSECYVMPLRMLQQSNKEYRDRVNLAKQGSKSLEQQKADAIVSLFDGSNASVPDTISGLPNALIDGMLAGVVQARGADTVLAVACTSPAIEAADIAVRFAAKAEHADWAELIGQAIQYLGRDGVQAILDKHAQESAATAVAVAA